MSFIRYKTIEHERVEDAPFVGALISAIDCHIGCKDCFNQHLKLVPTKYATPDAIVHEVLTNPFNQGMIFAGLEWSEQADELVLMVEECLKSDLEVMIYTGLSLDLFLNRVPGLLEIEGSIYIKHGAYVPEKACYDNKTHSVRLATSNQSIDHIDLSCYEARKMYVF